jgi:hypothetical protein
MKKFIAILLVLFPLFSFGQLEQAKEYAATITEEDLKDYLYILASDALEGRETGERGQKMAAAFIRSHFSKWGLKAPVEFNGRKSYYQQVPLYAIRQKEVSVQAGGNNFKNFEHFMYYGQSGTTDRQNVKLVYAGYGSEEILEEIKPEGKAILVIAKERNWRKPVNAATEAGAEIVFVVMSEEQEDFNQMVNQLRPHLEEGQLSLEKPEADNDSRGVFFVSPEFAASVFNTKYEKLKEIKSEAGLKKIRKMKPVDLSYKISIGVDEIRSENVLGYLPGSDLKEEVVVLTAHYDHVGKSDGEIYNGADDDASGTSAVMEIAEAFVEAAKNGDGPRRSILFLLVTAEEKGLLGSAHYADNPTFPLANTIVNLNIDMIGRVDPKHEDNPDYVYLVGADRLSTELHEISEKVNERTTNLELDYTYNDEDHPERIYYRSDHWNFAKNNVPIIFYFNGVHEDYHKPTDTVDKITWDILRKRTALVFYTAWELANRDERPVVDKLE